MHLLTCQQSQCEGLNRVESKKAASEPPPGCKGGIGATTGPSRCEGVAEEQPENALRPPVRERGVIDAVVVSPKNDYWTNRKVKAGSPWGKESPGHTVMSSHGWHVVNHQYWVQENRHLE